MQIKNPQNISRIMPFRKIIAVDALSLTLFVIDRILKSTLQKDPFAYKDFFDSGILKIQRYENTGVAFSIPLPQWLILSLSTTIVLALAWFLMRALQKKQSLAVLFYDLIIVGALSNIIDRLLYGHVIDYINFIFYFWIFNIADIMITVGIAGILFLHLRETKKPR
ncbi:MAG TPA: signal peptidase II [Patescibacteria group bacterium]|nr:signal peptidase II [Patescibacteria group bacterium]